MVQQGMRLVVWLVVVLVACKDTSQKKPAEDPVADWKPIEALATTPPSSGDSNELVRALDLAKQHGASWGESDVLEMPGAVDAISALNAWATAKGALPPLDSPMQLGVAAMSMNHLATAAVAANAAEAVHYLGSKLITDGRNFLEVQVGISVLHLMTRKPAADVPKLDLVRVLAAEAMQSRASMSYSASPAGQAELDKAVKEMPEHERQAAKQGRPNDAQMKALEAFWLAALKGARRGEATETTLARVQSAADTAPDGIKDMVAIIPRTLQSMVSSYDELVR